jgi:hypothetical protein
MRMKEHFWPAEQQRRPIPVVQALRAGAREFKRELGRQKQAKKVRDLPDPFKN